MFDATIFYRELIKQEKKKGINRLSKFSFDLSKLRFVLATIHRAENTDNKEVLINIFSALKYRSAISPIMKGAMIAPHD